MEDPQKHSIVIAVSGPSGSGKTTLVHNVAGVLKDATIFITEHYQAAENKKKVDQGEFVLHDPVAWKEANYDLNIIDIISIRCGKSDTLC